ncbi:MAG: hypothetical protein PHD31_00645 [Candidatus Pacebacteria bacterium]|nr:hypothetical protein [Candidatus Paceibacterota bacterium]
MFGLTEKDIPCCYNLGLQSSKEPCLKIDIHEDFIESMETKTGWAKIHAEKFKKKYDFQNISLDFYGNFGIDDAFINKGNRNDFIEFLVPIPSISTVTKIKCDRCNGSGKDPYSCDDSPCLSCRGTGKKLKDNWKPIRKTVLSLSLFTDIARYAYGEAPTLSRRKQLLSLIVFADTNYSIGGDMSPAFCWYLENIIGRSNLENVQEAMRHVYSHIWGGERDSIFQAYVEENGFLVLNCLNGGICPTSYSFREGKGANFRQMIFQLLQIY